LIQFCDAETIFPSLCKIAVKSTIIDLEQVQRAVNLLLEADAEEEINNNFASSSSSAIAVINVFDIPRYKYDAIRRNFYQ
jgi:DNA polymerase epsilon subunit 2